MIYEKTQPLSAEPVEAKHSMPFRCIQTTHNQSRSLRKALYLNFFLVQQSMSRRSTPYQLDAFKLRATDRGLFTTRYVAIVLSLLILLTFLQKSATFV